MHLCGFKFLISLYRFHHCWPICSWREESDLDHILTSQTCFLGQSHLPAFYMLSFLFLLLVKPLFPVQDLQMHLLTRPRFQLMLKLNSPSSPWMHFSSEVSLSPQSPTFCLTLHRQGFTEFPLPSLQPTLFYSPHSCPDALWILQFYCNKYSWLISFSFSPSSNPFFTLLLLLFHNTV